MTSASTDEIRIITVPTKQHDGGSKYVSRSSADATVSKPKVDAFAKYSSNLVRLKTLLCLGDSEGDEDNLDYLGSLNDVLRKASIKDRAATARARIADADADASKRRRGNNSHPITQQRGLERKTRISFEVDPSLLLHDLLYFDDFELISDDEGEEKLGEDVPRSR